jgi:MFS family permease
MADDMEAKGPKLKTGTGLKSTVRALRHRNFLLFFGGQSISLIGSWMQRIALAWAVYRLTNSPFLLGVVGFAGEIPVFILAPFAGVMADRWNRQRLLILTQTLATVQAFALSVLVLTETALVWHFVVLSIFLGIVNAFDIPIRQSFTVEMVEEKEDLGNAIALNSSMVNAARLLGPSAAGLLIAAVGEGQCFLVNGFSYLPVIAALIAMKIQPKNRTPQSLRVWQQLKAGFRYASGFAPIRAILLLLGLISLMGMPYTVLMPIFARDVLHGGPHELGFLMGAVGMGALVGAFYLASRKTVLGLEQMIVLASSIFGLGLIAFAFSRVQWFSLVLMLITGWGQMVQMASSNIILQTIVDDDKRGRIMSFYTMAFRGMTPFGSLIAGSLADEIGAPGTVFIGGITCLLGAALFLRRLPALREMIRPIYVRMGIISEIGLGIQSTTELPVSNENQS